MTPLNALYVVVAVVVACVGGALTLLLWQVIVLLKEMKANVVPRLEDLLTQSGNTLEQAALITGDLKEKLARLDSTLDEAQITLHAVVEAGNFVNEGIVRPASINFQAFKAGSQAAWQRLMESRKNAPDRPALEPSSDEGASLGHPGSREVERVP